MSAGTLAFNEFIHNGTKYNVWVQDGFKPKKNQIAHVYKEGDKMPIVGTTFGNMASFEKDIMVWAKLKISTLIN